MTHEHIVITENALREVKFRLPNRGSDKEQLEVEDRAWQVENLTNLYASAIHKARQRRDELNVDKQYLSSGVYIDVEVNEKTINLDSLDTNSGAKLMNIKKAEKGSETISATLFLPDKNAKWLNKKLNQYKRTLNEKKPKNARLINNIINIDDADILRFFTKDDDVSCFNGYNREDIALYEVWIYREDLSIEDVNERLVALGIEYTGSSCDFADITVVLVKSTKKNLKKLAYSIDRLAEIRLFRQPSILLSGSTIEQRDWTKLIKDNVVIEDNLTRVGVLDSGVDNSHPLLSDFLPRERCHDCTDRSIQDKHNHGTLLAGLVQYGDLTDVIYQKGAIRVNTDLSSVKIIPGRDEPPNEEKLYGVIAEQAICKARDTDGASILCSAVTIGESETRGEPSLWSSAIDETLYNRGKADSVLFLSAGNVRHIDGPVYPDFNIDAEVEDPAQSWNAVTVGAYTEKCVIGDPRYVGITPLAPKGGLSPWSRTSTRWKNSMPIKPEILMEGGNAILEYGELSDTPDDINLVSTCETSLGKRFDYINATSAATALAARLAAKIKSNNPQLSALSVRALMIHSAEWTDEMKRQNPSSNGKLNISSLLRTCGYGVPNEEKAIASNDSYATFVAEQELLPLGEGSKGKGTLTAMHVYELPWPKTILEQMGAERVRLKITLSYYVEPSPSSRTKVSKYYYPSLRLYFDVNRPEEATDSFIQRISHIAIEGAHQSSNDTTRWGLGIKERNRGSIISDYIEATAVQIASCNKIAVYPATGWWTKQKYESGKSIKYSLIVSLETENTEIYNAIPQEIPIVM